MKPPLPNSYWVEPGRMLAGEHPDGGGEAGTRTRIAALVAAGVRSFIDLTAPDELKAYRPLLPPGVGYESFPMPDHSVPHSWQQMRELQDALARLMNSAPAVYVHCRAGIGRTGVTVGCYLREQGESGESALAELNRLWRQSARAARWPNVPETDEQQRYIRQWLPRRPAAESLPRYRGCLIGLAVGDVVANTPADADADASAWTDDTGTTLCVAESLLAHGRFDGRDQLERYRLWAADPAAAGAARSATLRPVIREVLARMAWNRSPLTGSHDPAQQDASALARCAAPALFATGDQRLAGSLGADIARVTHQAPVLVDACRLLSAMISAALQGESKAAVLTVATRLDGLPLRQEVRAVAELWPQQGGRRRALPPVLAAFDRAVRAFARGRDFADGLERVTSVTGPDRDAVAAAYGALAGACYSEAGIPAALRARVAGLQRLEELAAKLLRREGAVDGALP